MVLFLFVGGYLVVGVVVAAIAFQRRVTLVQVVLLVPLWPSTVGTPMAVSPGRA
jgi:hypothetical protein